MTLAGFNRKTFRTLEFLLVVVTNVAAWLAALADSIPDRWAVYATAGSGALYALARGFAKLNSDTKDYWHTTEFWVALLSVIPTVLAGIDGTLGTHTTAIVSGIIAAALGIANGVRKQPEVAAGNLTALDHQELVAAEHDLFVPDVGVDPASDHSDLTLAAEQEAEIAKLGPEFLDPEGDPPDPPGTPPAPPTPPPAPPRK